MAIFVVLYDILYICTATMTVTLAIKKSNPAGIILELKFVRLLIN